MNQSIAIIFSLMAGLLWASAQLAGKFALKDASPLTLNTIRFTIFLPLTLISLKLSGKHTLPKYPLIPVILLIGILGWGVGSQLYFFILKKDALHRIMPISNAFPVWVALFSPIFLKEKFSPVLIPVLAMVISGTYLLTPKDEKSNTWRWGVPLSIATSFCWAMALMATKYFLSYYDPTTMLFLKVVGVTVMFWLFIPFHKMELTKNSITFSLLSGIFLFAGELFYTFALQKFLASYISIFCNTVIPFGFLLSVILLKEKPSLKSYIGMILIFTALTILAI